LIKPEGWPHTAYVRIDAPNSNVYVCVEKNGKESIHKIEGNVKDVFMFRYPEAKMVTKEEAEKRIDPVIPKVGEFWKHKHSPTVYLRVVDVVGRRVHPNLSDSFFSIGVKCGSCYHTPTDARDIIILKNVNIS
jgi:hypothetical protein